jgi:hypothetical protein
MTGDIPKLLSIWCKAWAVLFSLVVFINAILLVVLGEGSVKSSEFVAALGLTFVSVGFYGVPIFLVSSGAVFGGIFLLRLARETPKNEPVE